MALSAVVFNVIWDDWQNPESGSDRVGMLCVGALLVAADIGLLTATLLAKRGQQLPGKPPVYSDEPPAPDGGGEPR